MKEKGQGRTTFNIRILVVFKWWMRWWYVCWFFCVLFIFIPPLFMSMQWFIDLESDIIFWVQNSSFPPFVVCMGFFVWVCVLGWVWVCENHVIINILYYWITSRKNIVYLWTTTFLLILVFFGVENIFFAIFYFVRLSDILSTSNILFLRKLITAIFAGIPRWDLNCRQFLIDYPNSTPYTTRISRSTLSDWKAF